VVNDKIKSITTLKKNRIIISDDFRSQMKHQNTFLEQNAMLSNDNITDINASATFNEPRQSYRVMQTPVKTKDKDKNQDQDTAGPDENPLNIIATRNNIESNLS